LKLGIGIEITVNVSQAQRTAEQTIQYVKQGLDDFLGYLMEKSRGGNPNEQYGTVPSFLFF